MVKERQAELAGEGLDDDEDGGVAGHDLELGTDVHQEPYKDIV